MAFRWVRLSVAATAAALGTLAAGAGVAAAASWTSQVAPGGPQPYTSLNSVSCPSVSACMAVGQTWSVSAYGPRPPFGEFWDGSAWTVVTTPNVPGQADGFLRSVSCSSAADCIAVGWSWTNGDPTYRYWPLAEHWDGGSWSLEDLPAPAGATSVTLAGVSCQSASDCTVLGLYIDVNRDTGMYEAVWTPFADHWNGSSWSLQVIAGPTGAAFVSDADLHAISCTSASACTAVGRFQDAASAWRWDGIAWAPQVTPDVPDGTGASFSELLSVSCPSASACTAVGSAVGGDPWSSTPLAERWDGTAWTAQQPATDGPTALSGISCASPAVCMAVGGSRIERWSPASGWRLEDVQAAGDLTSISCPKANVCTAVGTSSQSGGSVPVVERYW